ncbi:MAG: sulfatase-like hydrolase/transferase [Chlamydiia bacterium]|nr:sulfatase-like hydrolase/transferase [Chlamydiia bacterium]
MTTLWMFLLFLTLPALIVRCTVLHRHLAMRPSLLISYVVGVCQDFFITFEQLFLFALFRSLFPFAGDVPFWVFVLFATLLQLHLIVDAILHRKTAIRMEVSFLSLINDARCFLDSAKEKRIWRFLPIATFFVMIPAWSYWMFWDRLQAVSLDKEWLLIGGCLGIIGAIGHYFLPKKLSYATDQIVFQHQLHYVQKLFRFIKRKNDRTDMGLLKRIRFQSQNEKKSTPSSEYPLFKYTQGFSGEKVFDVSVGEGEKPHVIFLFMESFRGKNVGTLGAKNGASPHFDRLSQEGILFTDFYANSVRTSRSALSSLFGIPSDMDGSEVASKTKTPFIGIPQLMQEGGYQTSYLHNGPIEFEKQDQFFSLHGFDTVHGGETIAKDFPKIKPSSWGLPDECLMNHAANFLEANKETPQFLTLFTITNHHPWNLPAHYQPPAFPLEVSRIYRKYLNTFHYSDACLGLFVDLLREKGLLENTLLFVLGDHGYPMGEHNNFVEQRYLYEENIHVPLLIYGKGRILEPKRMTTPASQLDLVPTLMDLLGLHGFNLSIGSSLMRNLSERAVYFHNPYVFKNFGCRYGKYKFIYTRISQEVELYDLETDPEEKRNIARHHPKLVCDLLHGVKDYKRLFHHLYGDKRIVPMDEGAISPGSFTPAPLDLR